MSRPEERLIEALTDLCFSGKRTAQFSGDVANKEFRDVVDIVDEMIMETLHSPSRGEAITVAARMIKALRVADINNRTQG